MPNFAGASNTTRRERYGWQHQKERARLKPIVDAGRAWCAQPICLHHSRWIPPGSRWALGHNDAGTEWIGPVHWLCNQRDGAAKGGRVALAKRRHHPRRWHSRSW